MSPKSALIKTGVNVAKNFKSVMKYGAAALTGYEIGEALHEDSSAAILSKETPPKFGNKTSDELNQSLIDIKILLIVIIVAILIVVLLLLGYKTYLFIGKRARKDLQRSLERGVFEICGVFFTVLENYFDFHYLLCSG